MLDIRHDLAFCRTVRTQLVGDHALRSYALLPKQSCRQALGGLGVASAVDNLIEHKAVLIDSPSAPIAKRFYFQTPPTCGGYQSTPAAAENSG